MRRRVPFGLVLTSLASLAGSPAAQTDLTITTRETWGFGAGEPASSTDVLYVSGNLRRHDDIDTGGNLSQVRIEQCDARRRLLLFPRSQTYSSVSRPSPEEQRARAAPAIPRPPAASTEGPLVTVTIETRDTTERREMSGLVARHVVTTETVAPSPGAMTPASVAVTDGWYIDVEAACPDDLERGFGFHLGFFSPGRPMDRVVVEMRGRPVMGYAIEATHTDSLANPTIKTTLVSVTRSKLDPRLFEVPPDYQPALPLPGGGVDPARPDSAVNRVRSYFEWAASWVTSWFQ